MKLAIDLDDLESGGDYSETVARLIRDEIHNCIRAEIRILVKGEKEKIKEAVSRVAKEALKNLRSVRLQEIAKDMAETL